METELLLLKSLNTEGLPMGASVLCRKLKESQATVGRKLHALEREGLIKKVSNKGRVLTPKGRQYIAMHSISSQKNAIANELIDMSFSTSKKTLLEIMSIRILLEPHTAAQAAQLAREDEIEELENYAFAHRYALSRGLASNTEDLNFHLAIARIARNETLCKLLELLLTDNDAYVQFSKAGKSQLTQQVEGHFAVLDAIKGKDAGASRAAMIQHLEHVYGDVEDNYVS